MMDATSASARQRMIRPVLFVGVECVVFSRKIKACSFTGIQRAIQIVIIHLKSQIITKYMIF